MIQGVVTYLYEVEEFSGSAPKKLEDISFTSNNSDKIMALIKFHSGGGNSEGDLVQTKDGYEVRSINLRRYTLIRKDKCGGVSLFD